MPTYADTQAEEYHFRETEPFRNEKAYVLKAIVPNGGQRSAYLQIDTSGDFQLLAICGAAQGPVDVNGAPLVTGSQNSDFPYPGVTTAGSFGTMADRGLLMKITDLSNGNSRTLTLTRPMLNATATQLNQWVPIETMLCGGYGYYPAYFRPQPFKYFLQRGTLWRFDLLNRDAGLGDDGGDPAVPVLLFHRLDIALIGRRYAV